jgi:hypothetical protein
MENNILKEKFIPGTRDLNPNYYVCHLSNLYKLTLWSCFIMDGFEHSYN